MDDPARLAFASGLSREERLLVLVRDELYEGRWEDLVLDLQARRERKPFVFKLATRIDEDLQRIARLAAFEEQEGVNLRALLPPGGKTEAGERPGEGAR